MAHEGYVPVASLEVTSVKPAVSGFQLQGLGADASDYLLEMHIDMPIDQRTRAVLGEILSQSEWQIYRRAHQPLKATLHDRKTTRIDAKP